MKDNGRYLIKPSPDEAAFMASCDFSRERTIVHFDLSNDNQKRNFEGCSGQNCSEITFSYQPSRQQIEKLKGEMRYCSQSLKFDCVSRNVLTRIRFENKNIL